MSLSAAGPGAVWRWARYAPRRHRLRGHEFVPGIRRVELNLERRGPIRTPEGRHEIPTHRTRRLPLLLVRLRVAGGRGRAGRRDRLRLGFRGGAGVLRARDPGPQRREAERGAEEDGECDVWGFHDGPPACGLASDARDSNLLDASTGRN